MWSESRTGETSTVAEPTALSPPTAEQGNRRYMAR